MKRLNDEERELLIQAYNEYVSNVGRTSSTANISKFLSSTESLSIRPSRRLIGLGSALTNRITWSDVCVIYQASLLSEGQREGIYITWLDSATHALDAAILGSTMEDGSKIIKDSFEILAEAMRNNPRHNGFAFMTGYFTYRHAIQYDDSPDQFEKALNWLSKAEEWQQEDYGEVDNRIKFYIGRCYIALKRWDKALAYYKSVDEGNLADEVDEEFVTTLRNDILHAQNEIRQADLNK
ncbi:MAG TPA: hypothetical protein V6C97_08765 [Oculatellaceae cyanobacterium]